MKICPQCGAKYTDETQQFCPFEGARLRPPDDVKNAANDDDDPLVGQVLDGQYKIENLVARGGMGAVYRARHTLLGDTVAVKILRQDMATNSEWMRRFLREGQAARRFRHQNAVTVYDLRTTETTTGDQLYMVMELVEGRTLADELKARGRLSAAEAFAVIEPVLSVLDAAHTSGIVHRDLKPENVMIGEPAAGKSNVKLLDLGIAKMRDLSDVGAAKEGAQLTMVGQLLGTPYYMSPEQWGELPRDGSDEIDGRADIYAVGLILYELLAGNRPFTGRSVAELRRNHVHAAPAPLHNIAPNAPPAFAHAVMRALAKDRSERPPTAAVFSRELSQALSGNQQSYSPTIYTPTAPLHHNPTDASRRPTTASPGQPFTNPPTYGGSHSQAPVSQNPVSRNPVSQNPVSYAPVGQAPAARVAGTVQGYYAAPGQQQFASAQPYNLQNASQTNVPPPRAKSGSYSWTMIGIGAAVVLVVGVALFGLFAIVFFTPRGANTPANTNTGGYTKPTNARVDAMRFYFQVFPAGGLLPTRVAGSTLRAEPGGQVKIFFKPREDGYLYLVAPMPDTPTTFLSDRPAKETSVETNKLTGGEDFMFPGLLSTIILDAKPRTEVFTIVYSKTRLTAPAFFAKNALRRLSAAEQTEYAQFRREHPPQKSTLRTEQEDGGAVAVVSFPEADFDKGEPVVIDVRVTTESK